MIKPKKPLYDGVAMSREYPDTFFIPSEAIRTNLKPGASAKIGCDGERFWTEIKEVRITQAGTSYVARVDNDLQLTAHGLKCDDLIEIEPKHILAVN
ncbi:hypothetical protein KIKIMORA_00680 [Brevundimonas phage vB_BpoS-Kikimora]|uniref:Uncharacterized protein n=1 Tax=Brevundimonas phage vB_BpoS-Kikimora TaxID=2948601 RepID=A0A9E7MSD1_9CAUD|nr:hypothetical protein KIKIMORA_00680 [Brevundimonas phage vB_BpoS-Kikimora]